MFGEWGWSCKGIALTFYNGILYLHHTKSLRAYKAGDL